MLTILNLFGRSPFAPLRSHMDQVTACVNKVTDLFDALERQDYAAVEQIAKKIEELEHHADLTKNDIRNHLPKSLFLPMDRHHLLEILGIQDNIADRIEDIAVMVTLKKLQLPSTLKEDFQAFLDKNLEAFQVVRSIIKELHELLESSFGGIEAEKVRAMVDDVAYKEHEVDVLQRKLLRGLFANEDDMSYGTFYLWNRIFSAVADISNLSEKLANRMRMTLELK